MSPTPMSPAATEPEPGQLLYELEQRQDEVLQQLDALDAKLNEVLQGLGVTVEEDSEAGFA